MQLEKSIRAIIRNPVFSNLLMVFLLVIGLLSAQKMPREFFPQFSLDLIKVSVPYPGASQEEVEEGICIKLENAVEGLDGISKVTTTADEGLGSMLVEVDPGFDTKRVKDDIQNEIDRIDTFPEEAEQPQIKEILKKDMVVSLALFGDAPERTLKEVARRIKDDLLDSPQISNVTLAGVRDYEISVEVSEKTLRKYNISIRQVAEAIRRGSLDLPAGQIKSSREEITIRTKGQRYTGRELGRIVVLARADGSMVRLGEIAEIKDGFSEDPHYARFNGKRAVTINVYKTPSQDIIKIADRVRDYIAEENSRLPPGLRLSIWRDFSKMVRDRLNLLVDNGVLGLCLVLLTLWFFLDIRLSFWVGMGIPVSFAGALWFMDLSGQSVNMISMFGLLMAIGMIVDDAIVIGENVYSYIKRGVEPWQAAIRGTAEVALPVSASTVTTLAAFYPLFMVEGIMGKFIRVLPMAVIACLSASLLEALFILPVHLRHTRISPYHPSLPFYRRFPRLVRRKLDALTEFVIGRIYAPVYRAALDCRLVVFSLALAIFLLTLGLYRGGHVEFVLFPKTEEDVLFAKVTFPYGTAIGKAAAAAARLEKAARRVNEEFRRREGRDVVLDISSEVGGHSGVSSQSGPHLAQVSISLLPAEERKSSSESIKNAWRRATGRIEGVEALTFENPRHGPGGKPLHINLLGRDFERLEKAAEDLKKKLATYPGVFDIEDSLRPGKRELRLSLRPEARTLGLSLNDLAVQVRDAFYGAEAMRVQRGEDEVKVMVRYPLGERKSVANLDSMRILTPQGEDVPLLKVARIRQEKGYARILRQDGRRKVSVMSDLDESKNNAVRIVEELKAGFLPELLQRYPGISYAFEGQQKERQRSLASLLRGFIIALLLIFAIIAVLFKSYFQPLVIMACIPFGIVGAIWGHYLLGKDLSLLSLFGIVALSGIVVNDSLVLIDFINQALRSGRKLKEAVWKAGQARFRAVLLTTITTVAGLFPLLLERSLQAQFLIPMAISISFGLSFATLITLFLVPALYLLVNDIKRFSHWLIFGERVSPEQVEPYAFKNFQQ